MLLVCFVFEMESRIYQADLKLNKVAAAAAGLELLILLHLSKY